MGRLRSKIERILADLLGHLFHEVCGGAPEGLQNFPGAINAGGGNQPVDLLDVQMGIFGSLWLVQLKFSHVKWSSPSAVYSQLQRFEPSSSTIFANKRKNLSKML